MNTHTPNDACPGAHPIGTSLGNGVVGNWQALPGSESVHPSGNTERALRQCQCGCNVYSPAEAISEFPSGLYEIPALPIDLQYEDDDGPSDDHEYVTIKATEFADMLSDLRSCTCQDH